VFRTFALISAGLAALLGLLVASGREAGRAKGIGKGPDRAGGRTERCVTCHVKPDEDPGGAHARAALGCASCHLGNPLAFEKERAHEGLEREPGALSTVAMTCGREDCHARESARVATSPMTRASGIVSVDRFAFGEIALPDSRQTVADVLGAARATPAEFHLRKLCAGCHLGTRRVNRDDAIHGNGSGCAACHVARRENDLPRAHPPIDARVSSDRCFGCHSRSGRISLTYEGLAEIEPAQAAGAEATCAAPVALPDGRPVCRAAPDVHQAAGMACIDCHLHTELMGDGTARVHQEEQTEITCEACHGPVREGGEVPWREVKDEISKEIREREEREEDSLRRVKRGEGSAPDAAARLGRTEAPNNPLSKKSSTSSPDATGQLVGNVPPDISLSKKSPFAASPDAPTRLGRRGTPILNLLRNSSSSSSSWVLVRKLDGIALPVKQTPRDANHTRKGHERLSCSACHAAWAPRCDTCHTSYDASKTQWDFAAGKPTAGAWVERSEGFSWGPPLLGAQSDGKIVPAAPGMILDIDREAAGGGKTSHRLLAPMEPHSTGKKSRTCESCHRAPAAPDFEAGTRTGFRPLNSAEKKRIAAARLEPR
jgi:hypothetical protein